MAVGAVSVRWRRAKLEATEVKGKSRRTRRRRQRRQGRQALRFGRKAKPTHKLKSGRTGKSHHKKRQAALAGVERQQKRIVIDRCERH